MKPVFTNPVRQQEFEARGFTAARLLTAEKAESVWQDIDALLRQRDPGVGPPRCAISYTESDDEFRSAAEAIARKALAGPVAALVPDFRVVTGGFFVKPGGAGEVAIHRDWTNIEDPAQVALGIWCALADVDDSMGALRLVPGSHRLFAGITGLGLPHFFADYPDLLKTRSLPIALKAGEAVLFDVRTVHWSPPNRTERTRAAAHVVCIPNDCRHVSYILEPGSHGERFEKFDIGAVASERSIGQFAGTGRPGPSLGFVPNRNRPVSRQECERLLDQFAEEWEAAKVRRAAATDVVPVT